MRSTPIALALALLLPLAGCAGGPARSATAGPGDDHSGHAGHAGRGDAGFHALQERGATAMGVDQYTSAHRFDALPDGGRIELQREVDDPAGVARIRAHLRAVAEAFSRGDFATPAAVHGREVPGAAVLAAKRAVVGYTFRELPRGGEVRITTADPEALRAVHEFMAFQRSDHRAGGREP